MARMILWLELGDWTGGHHGKSPYIVEFDSKRLHAPFCVSEGWGHGLGGSSYSLARFVETEHYTQLKLHAPWATTIIEQGLPTLDIEAISQGLQAQYASHNPNIPANLAHYF
ncbi:hypothetical protein [Shewanella sp.]|uniref:hypothetical protein n=1 Tax=Shewanella sp. TaxID=50422 RepID=UPI003A83BE25